MYCFVAGINEFIKEKIQNFSFKKYRENEYKNLVEINQENIEAYKLLSKELKIALKLKKIYMKKIKEKKRFKEIKKVANFTCKHLREEVKIDINFEEINEKILKFSKKKNLKKLFKRIKKANYNYTLSANKYVKQVIKCIYLEELENNYQKEKNLINPRENSQASSTTSSIRESKYYEYFPTPIFMKIFCVDDDNFYKNNLKIFNSSVFILGIIFYFIYTFGEIEQIFLFIEDDDYFDSNISSSIIFGFFWVFGLIFCMKGAFKIGILEKMGRWKIENFNFLMISSFLSIILIFSIEHFCLVFNKSGFLRSKLIFQSTAYYKVKIFFKF